MTVAIAYDGDEAGQKALETVMLNALNLSDSEQNYIRSLCLNQMPMAQAVRSLTNRELADELGTWDRSRKVRGAPEWWYQMCEDSYAACIQEIQRRSEQINDSGNGAFEYVKNYQANHTITDVLLDHGIMATPGKNVTCPMHDDDTPSLSISRDDGVAYCFNQACILWGDGKGVTSFKLNKILSK